MLKNDFIVHQIPNVLHLIQNLSELILIEINVNIIFKNSKTKIVNAIIGMILNSFQITKNI